MFGGLWPISESEFMGVWERNLAVSGKLKRPRGAGKRICDFFHKLLSLNRENGFHARFALNAPRVGNVESKKKMSGCLACETVDLRLFFENAPFLLLNGSARRLNR